MNRPGHIQRAHEKSDQKRIYSERETAEIRRPVATRAPYTSTGCGKGWNELCNEKPVLKSSSLYSYLDVGIFLKPCKQFKQN